MNTPQMLKTMGLVTAALLVTAGCQGPRASRTVIDTDQIKKIQAANSTKAERLALAGEQLVPVAFFYANDVFDDALSIDPTNKRARFYKAVIKPLMVAKGIAARVRPLAEREGKLAELDAAIAKVPESGVRDFILDGAENIKDEASAQQFVVEVREAYDELRRFAKENKNLELTLNIPEILIGAQVEEKQKECKATATATGKFEIPCDISKVMKYKVGQAEMEGLQQTAAGMELLGQFYSSYSVDGLSSYLKVVESEKAPKTAAENVALIKSIKGLGVLNSNNTLSLVPKMGLDFIAGAKWVIKNQKELCPKGKVEKNNRPGFVLGEGLCHTGSDKQNDGKTLDEVLALAEQMLSGPMANHVVKTNSGKVVTTVDATAPFVRPVGDLKNLLPTTFNECGKATSVPDKTLGGVFPRGDGQTVLEMNGDLGQACVK